jgi:PBP1b-binding outer membrane lipoprotein LpoB
MRILLIIACALLLSACFSEDMKSSRNDSANAPTMVSALQSPTSSAETIETTHRNKI